MQQRLALNFFLNIKRLPEFYKKSLKYTIPSNMYAFTLMSMIDGRKRNDYLHFRLLLDYS